MSPSRLLSTTWGWGGSLVLLPTHDVFTSGKLSDLTKVTDVCNALSDLGRHYYEINRQRLGIRAEDPTWLLEFRVEAAARADQELELLENTKTELLARRDKYDRMLALINGFGQYLEDAVGELFGKEWLGFSVDKTEKGHPIDLFITDPQTTFRLAVQVTGLVGKFTQDDKHFGALFSYLPLHVGRNLDKRSEKIVIVANTYRDIPLMERTDKEDISPAVCWLLENNDICLIRSVDLYHLWKKLADSQDALPSADFFRSLFECKGVWSQPHQ